MKILIYGYGRIGRTFHKILAEHYVKVYDKNPEISEIDRNDIKKFNVVVLCIPESSYEEALKQVRKSTLIVDVSSTKEKTLPILRRSGHKYLSIHPLFGENIYPYFSEVVYVESNCEEAESFLSILRKDGMKIVSVEEHDREMAKVQGVPHFLLLALSEYVKDVRCSTALLKALLALSSRVRSQNPEVMSRIQEVSVKERKSFIKFLEEFEIRFMDNFPSYFGVEGDFSFIINAAKIYEKPKSLEEYRNYLEVLDSLIVDLIRKREEISKEIALLKKTLNHPIEVKEVEERKLNRLLRDVRNPLLMEQIFLRIFQLSKEVQYETLGIRGVVGVLGPQGSYSEEMALRLVGSRTFLKYYRSIEDVVSAVDNCEVTYGVVPIENSLTGSVLETIEALLKHEVNVVGEAELPIAHCLVARSNIPLDKVRYVYSHPQAVMQCLSFIRRYLTNAEIVYSSSTAEALKMLDDASAAIASESAARLHNLVILRRDIQDDRNNITRFYVISKDCVCEGAEVTALFFSIEDRPGALKEVLEVFYKERINLRKLESHPDKFRRGKYIFFTEAEACLDDAFIEKLKEVTEYVKIAGRFRKIEFLAV